jgi:Ca-activated chloride channel family protein
MNKILFTAFLLITFCLDSPAQETPANSAKLDFVAADKSGALVGDLKKEELSLLIGGKPQTITALEKQESPLVYALAVDCSGSMRMMLDNITSAAKAIVAENQPTDETLPLRFVGRDNIRAAKSFSADKNVLNQTLENFYIEGGPTALIDAIYLAVQKVAEHQTDDGSRTRRAVIVITDGEDRDSFYTEAKLGELLAKENVQIFFIGLTDALAEGVVPGKSKKDRSEDLMKRIAEQSGGTVVFPKKKKLIETAAALLPLIRTRYTLTYTPTGITKADSQKSELKLAKDSKREDVRFYVGAKN